VYHSLLAEDRAKLHEKSGIAIETMHTDNLDDYTDLLAHHYGHSDNVEKALEYLILAGDNARKQASYWEALDYYGMAMERAERLTDEQRRKQMIVDLVIKRSFARHWLGALKPDIKEHEKYLELVGELGDKDKTRSFYFYLASHCLWTFEDFGRLEKYCERLASTGEDAVIQRIEKVFGKGYERLRCYEFFAKGRHEEAITIAGQIWEVVKTQAMEGNVFLAPANKAEIAYYITHPLNFPWIIARIYAAMGRWSESLSACQTMLDVAVSNSDSAYIIRGHAELGNTYLAMGEWDKAIADCETALNMSPSGIFIPLVATQLGDAYCKTRQIDKGIALLERWKTYTKNVGRGAFFECEYCLPLAEGYLMQEDTSRARTNADETLQIAQKHGYALHEAKAYRILGEIIAPRDFPSAEEHCLRSLNIMQRIKARNEEGKTELSWGRTCKQCDSMPEAKEHLTRAAAIFEELDTTRYLEWTQEAIAEITD